MTKPSGIGGQAVMEGVMMKNGAEYAVAVRTAKDKIDIKKGHYESFSQKVKLFQVPFFRGMLAMVESLIIGIRTLNQSASMLGEEEEEGKLEKKAKKVFGAKAESILTGITMAFSLVAAVAIFMLAPYFLSRLFSKVITSNLLLVAVEGVVRVLIFVLYVALISHMKEIHRVFMYHGAEHKSINCVEQGFPLTVENVRKQSTRHKRCGTSFMFLIMVISIFVHMFIRTDSTWLRILFRLLLLPVIAGISYEFIRLAGRSKSKVVDILSRPGLWLQKLTTREPEDDMIEVAIASVNAVFDWEAFQSQETAEEERPKEEKSKKKEAAKAEEAPKEAETPKAEKIPQVEETKKEKTATGRDRRARSRMTDEERKAKILAEPEDQEFAQLEEIVKQAQRTRNSEASREEAERNLSEFEEEEGDDLLSLLNQYSGSKDE